MFYQATITNLRADLTYARDQWVSNEKLYRAEQELRLCLEKDLDAALRRARDATERANRFQISADSLEEDLTQTHDINLALADESRDLVRQLELYKAVLGQLCVPVKLPAKRK